MTKKLIYSTESELLSEIRSLLYLCSQTNRSLILPNVLGPNRRVGLGFYEQMSLWPGFRLIFWRKDEKYYKNNKRTATHQQLELTGESSKWSPSILEPAFYWRIRRDYSQVGSIPLPQIVTYSLSVKDNSLEKILHELRHPSVHSSPRIVLDVVPWRKSWYGQEQIEATSLQSRKEQRSKQLLRWSEDSVGGYQDYEEEASNYGFLPFLEQEHSQSNRKLRRLTAEIIESTRLCARIFMPMKGNRSCFDKCD